MSKARLEIPLIISMAGGLFGVFLRTDAFRKGNRRAHSSTALLALGREVLRARCHGCASVSAEIPAGRRKLRARVKPKRRNGPLRGVSMRHKGGLPLSG